MDMKKVHPGFTIKNGLKLECTFHGHTFLMKFCWESYLAKFIHVYICDCDEKCDEKL